MFGAREVLVAAKQLLEIDGVDIDENHDTVDYFHILFERHEIVYSNGAEAESLYAGPEALRSTSLAAREEIFAIFPELRDQDSHNIKAPARPLINGRKGRQLAMRHNKNRRQLVS